MVHLPTVPVRPELCRYIEETWSGPQLILPCCDPPLIPFTLEELGHAWNKGSCTHLCAGSGLEESGSLLGTLHGFMENLQTGGLFHRHSFLRHGKMDGLLFYPSRRKLPQKLPISVLSRFLHWCKEATSIMLESYTF